MKRGRLTVKQIKSLLYDFYTGDVLSIAKDILFDTLQPMKIDGLPKTSRKRRDSKENQDVKIHHDIDDIIALVGFLDEKKLLDSLPIFFAANTDMIPSVMLLEGVMFVILSKSGVSTNKRPINKPVRTVAGRPERRSTVQLQGPDPGGFTGD